jgi:hypothetical protein
VSSTSALGFKKERRRLGKGGRGWFGWVGM